LRVDGENFSAGSVERILNRFPPATSVAVYGVPDPVSGDQVMAAIEIPETAGFDPSDFAVFLAGQPDLGTKWVPRFVRVLADLPVTGAGKLDKAPLRAQAWKTSDPIWWKPSGGLSYCRFTDADGAELLERFRSNGRESFWPCPAV
jgi:fatty-acyl-CoA synthase